MKRIIYLFLSMVLLIGTSVFADSFHSIEEQIFSNPPFDLNMPEEILDTKVHNQMDLPSDQYLAKETKMYSYADPSENVNRIVSSVIKYNDSGDPILESNKYADDSIKITERNYEFNNSGLLIRVECKNSDSITYNYSYAYDNAGKQIQTKYIYHDSYGDSSETTKYHYNSKGLIEKIVSVYGENGVEIPCLFQYDSKGNIIKMIERNEKDLDEMSDLVTTFEYDDQNRLIKKIEDDEYITIISYDSNGNITEYNNGYWIRKYQFNKNNCLIKKEETLDGEKQIIEYQYNENGKLISEVMKKDSFDYGLTGYNVIFEYNDHNQLIREKKTENYYKYDGNYIELTVKEYNYDETGLLQKEKSEYYSDYEHDASACDVVETIYEYAVKSKFKDVHTTDYFFNAVNWAVEQDITKGTSDTTFSPFESCTRAQAVTFLWRANGSEKVTEVENPFADVKETDYYYDAVLWALNNNITNGMTANTFGPNVTCNRGQIVTFLHRSVAELQADSKIAFTDVQNTAYYYKAVQWAVENNVTNGTSKTTFSPNDSCTRGQIVTFLFRALTEKGA